MSHCSWPLTLYSSKRHPGLYFLKKSEFCFLLFCFYFQSHLFVRLRVGHDLSLKAFVQVNNLFVTL